MHPPLPNPAAKVGQVIPLISITACSENTAYFINWSSNSGLYGLLALFVGAPHPGPSKTALH